MGNDEMFEGAGFSLEDLDNLLGDQPAASEPSDGKAGSVSNIIQGVQADQQPDTYEDKGEFRSVDGNREYHAFDASMPDASSDEWYSYRDTDRELDQGRPQNQSGAYSDEYDDDYDEDYYDEDDYEEDERKPKKRSVVGTIFSTILGILTVVSVLYLFFVYSDIPVIKQARETYILTAMSTINHKYLATALIPSDIIDDVMEKYYSTASAGVGIESNWGAITIEALPETPDYLAASEIKEPNSSLEPDAPDTATEEAMAENDPAVDNKTDRVMSADESYFFNLFPELDEASVRAYMDEHPDTLTNGWYFVNVDESSLDASGTSMKTIYGDQVLAVNALDGVILIRVYLSSNNSRGVLAICKDTSRISLCPAATLGTEGQTAGTICDDNGGILAITGSAFWDPEGMGNGGALDGLAVCSGRVMGTALGGSSKRLELRDDNMMYIMDSASELAAGTRDACEFYPALIIDGEVLAEDPDWDGINPRTALGQSNRLETMMLILEGRYADSMGCSTIYVAEKLKQYGCVQAMNLDGGTSSIMYYNGKYVTRCSNPETPSGRPLPTAWVYSPYTP